MFVVCRVFKSLLFVLTRRSDMMIHELVRVCLHLVIGDAASHGDICAYTGRDIYLMAFTTQIIHSGTNDSSSYDLHINYNMPISLCKHSTFSSTP